MLPMEIISPFSLILNVALNGVLENDASLMLRTAFFVASADRSLVLAIVTTLTMVAATRRSSL
jgi:hypothetical protein